MRLTRSIPLAAFVAVAAAWPQDSTISYPESRRSDHVDVIHGVDVPDPYRWLEDDVRESDEVAKWVERQNEITFTYLKSIPEREQIEKRLTELWNYEKYSSFFKKGGQYFFFKNDGLQNQDVLYVQESLKAEPRVLADPNQWTEDGTSAMGALAVSPDARYLAYGVNDAGSDWQTWRVLEIESGRLLDDELRWVKFSGASWTKDGRGFFYSRYDQPEEGAAFQNTNLNQRVFYHRVGSSQSDDVLVYQRPDHPDWGFGAEVSGDGRWLVITIWKGTDEKYRVAYRDLNEPYAIPVDLITNFDNEYTFIDADGSTFYFETDLEAPTGRIIAIDVRHPERENWREVVPAAKETLRASALIGNMFVAQYLKDARSQAKLYSMDGETVREVEFPGIGTADGFIGDRGDTETFYSFSSFALPAAVYRLDLITATSRQIFQPNFPADVSKYETTQIFYKSRDGSRIPMFITHRKGIELDGSNPTLLYGYGGFNIPITPTFSTSVFSWLDLGGIWAVANLRGGGEYGEEWHRAGTKLDKQNVFDDFIAAAEWLIENKYTRTEKLAIHGRSNGGLLVGAAITQRPELFGAALPGVGVMDMLRFHKFTAGRFWVDDYGSAENAEEFKALLAYSPYHNLKNHSKYPPTLATTADTDDRVVPGHSFKFAAEMQHRQKAAAPALIRIETSAGHGGGTPTSKLIEQWADLWAFLVKNLDMKID
jgi:prolyl oligopeptidase